MSKGRALGAVVFDFDGTLADTEWPIYLRARAAAERLGADLTPELWATHAVGVSQREPWWAELSRVLDLDIDQPGFEAVMAEVDDVPTARDTAVIADGAADLIAALSGAGVPMAVASGSHREWLEHHLGRFGLSDHLPVLVGIDHPGVRAGKPEPDLYLAAVLELDVDPVGVVAVEDTHRGIEAARRAGLGAVVAVPSKLTTHHDLTGADRVVASLAELTVESLGALVAAVDRAQGR